MTGKPLQPIPPGQKQDWQIRFNGVPLVGVRSLEIERGHGGTLITYGLTPHGYDGVSVDGFAGPMILPYLQCEDGLYAGLIEEDRFREGGKIWAICRGGLDPCDRGSFYLAAFREAQEEIGLDSRFIAERLIELPGEPGNPDPGIFGGPRGVEHVVFRLPVKPEEVLEDTTFQTIPAYMLRQEFFYRKNLDPGEHIDRFRFFPARFAATTCDMLTNAAVARLAAFLRLF